MIKDGNTNILLFTNGYFLFNCQRLKWPFATTRLTAYVTCSLMSELVLMSLLRPNVNKSTKLTLWPWVFCLHCVFWHLSMHPKDMRFGSSTLCDTDWEKSSLWEPNSRQTARYSVLNFCAHVMSISASNACGGKSKHLVACCSWFWEKHDSFRERSRHCLAVRARKLICVQY